MLCVKTHDLAVVINMDHMATAVPVWNCGCGAKKSSSAGTVDATEPSRALTEGGNGMEEAWLAAHFFFFYLLLFFPGCRCIDCLSHGLVHACQHACAVSQSGSSPPSYPKAPPGRQSVMRTNAALSERKKKRMHCTPLDMSFHGHHTATKFLLETQERRKQAHGTVPPAFSSWFYSLWMELQVSCA